MRTLLFITLVLSSNLSHASRADRFDTPDRCIGYRNMIPDVTVDESTMVFPLDHDGGVTRDEFYGWFGGAMYNSQEPKNPIARGGVDLAAKPTNQVKSMSSGTIIDINPRFSKTSASVTIRTSERTVIRYGFLDVDSIRKLKLWDRVKPGTRLGRVALQGNVKYHQFEDGTKGDRLRIEFFGGYYSLVKYPLSTPPHGEKKCSNRREDVLNPDLVLLRLGKKSLRKFY